MNHQLENAVPHQAVVQGGGTTPPLEAGPCLEGKSKSVGQIVL